MEKSAATPAGVNTREQADDGNHPTLLIHVVLALAVLATLFGRALAPALPGSLAGIARVIRVVDLVGNLLTQLFAFAGISCALLLARIILQAAKKDLAFKLLLLPATLLVGFLVMVKMRVAQSDPNGAMTLALTSSGLALAAAPNLLKAERTRAMGLAITLGGAGGALHALGRYLAFKASLAALPTQFMLARVSETFAFALHLGVIALTVFWLWSRGPAFPAKLLGVAGLAAFVAIGSARGSLHHAAVWEVLASRSLGRLLSDPLPYLPVVATSMITILTLALAVWLLVKPKPKLTSFVLAFCLLSGGATDVPLLALCLVLGTIVAKLPLPESAPGPSPAPRNASASPHDE